MPNSKNLDLKEFDVGVLTQNEVEYDHIWLFYDYYSEIKGTYVFDEIVLWNSVKTLIFFFISCNFGFVTLSKQLLFQKY